MTGRFRQLAGLLLGLLLISGVMMTGAQAPVITPVAPVRDFTVVARYPHDVTAFTEGLIYVDGELFEGTGYEGHSQLKLVDLETGEALETHDLAPNEFGEGITILDDKIYQLTYRTEVAYVYDRESWEQTGTFTYDGEGWGLTTDGTSLIMSNGSDQIVYRDPETFEITKTISVKDGENPIANLNELEYIDGVIWANVWRMNFIARIDAETGMVIDWLDLSELDAEVTATHPGVDVLNGIAYDTETGNVLVTGKYWPTLFEIKVTDR